MVMAAHVIREKRQVNAPKTVRKLAFALNRLRLFLHPPGFPWKFLMCVYMCRPVLQILTLFQTKKIHFHTCFQIWPL